MNWIAIWVTFKLASLTALSLLVVGLPIAYWVSFSRKRWKFIVESVVALPLVLPPTVLGFYILVAIGPHSPFGRFYNELVGHPLPFTFEGLLLASILYSLPFAVQPFAAAFEQVDRRLIEASWTLGVSKLSTFFKLIVPLSKAGLVTGGVLSFAHTMGEFGVVLMVGGNLEGETRTVSIDIYDEVQALNYAGAAKTALFLFIVSYTVLLLVYAVNRNVWGSMAAEIDINIVKTFSGRAPIRAKIRYTVEASTVLILFGPSGSGKTTILRSLAGLEWPEEGTIQFVSRVWLDTVSDIRVAPQDRHIGYMSQDYALFPTCTVAGNIAFGLGQLSSHDRRKRVDEVLDLFQLRGLEKAKPRELSGGQQQRVALARAVAPRPLLLLLDEPLSALDAPTRVHLRDELRNLLKRLALPSIIVTHDWVEALTLGDVMAVISAGDVLQVGAPIDVFIRPQNADVARVVGVETVVKGRVVGSKDGMLRVSVDGTTLTAVEAESEGPEVFVCIRSEDVVLERGPTVVSSARNRVSGIVTNITTLGALARVTIDCGFPLVAMVTRSAVEEIGLVTGGPVVAAIKAGAVHLVSRQGQ